MAQDQWPSVGRVVHIRHRADPRCYPATVTEVVEDQPSDVIRVQAMPVAQFPHEFRVLRERTPEDAASRSDWLWHWPEFVGPAAEPA